MRRWRDSAATFLILLSALGASQTTLAAAPRQQTDEILEEIVVAAPYGFGIARDRVPANVQTATSQDIKRSQALDLTDFLNRELGSVSINHAQNNPLQPDVNFRGFTASPLLGLAQGLAVYQNGVRINEPFGDTVNWDLIPLSAISSMQLFAGANPVFGLNTLGGALSMQMKNGFNYQGGTVQAYGGSFGRGAAWAEYGGNSGGWGYYGDIDYFQEDGWRDFSDSDALRFFGALSRHEADWSLDLSVAYADTELRGNGPAPAELLAIDRRQVFTYPDITGNTLAQGVLEGSRTLSDLLHVSGNIFFRSIDTDTFNSNGAIYDKCAIGGEELLVEVGFLDLNGDGQCSSEQDSGIEPVLDLSGAPIATTLDGEELDATNNYGLREQHAYGGSVQLAAIRTCAGTRTISQSESLTTSGTPCSIPSSRLRACWRAAPRTALESSARNPARSLTARSRPRACTSRILSPCPHAPTLTVAGTLRRHPRSLVGSQRREPRAEWSA